MTSIQALMRERIQTGLQRKAVTSCARWAERYRMMGNPFPGKWSFEHHPWLLEMHDADCSKIIGQKAAQMGYTEWAMNTAFYNIDVEGLDVLYVLPTSSDASDFSAGRFDPALEMSPHLRTLFSDVNNVGLKRAGTNILYVRGSHSRSKLKSIPTPIIIFDEVDEMPRESIALAEERQSGQNVARILQLSTPTIEDHGINEEYKNSTQEHFFFKCPSCSRLTELLWPECFILTADSLTDPKLRDSHYICKECKNVLPHETKPDWLRHKLRGGSAHFVSSHTGRDTQGYQVSQFYSMAGACHPSRLAVAAIKARNDPTRAQEFYNSKLGLCYENEGARVTQKQLDACKQGYHQGTSAVRRDTVRTLGIDVGAVLHMVVKEFELTNHFRSINDSTDARILLAEESTGKVNDFDEAAEIFRQYRCAGCVVDAEPERRAALQFAQRFWGRVFLCDYLFSQNGREVAINEEEATIKVNRTSWLDLTLGRYKNTSVALPQDISLMFQKHVRALVRVYKEDKWGNPYGVYVSTGESHNETSSKKADHFAHADNYAEIALPLAASFAQNRDIRDLY